MVVEGRSEGLRKGVEVGQQVLVGGVQWRAGGPVGVGPSNAVGDHGRQGLGAQRTQDGAQDAQRGTEVPVTLPGLVGRGVAFAEEGHVDGLR